MLEALTALLLFQLLGEVIAGSFALPIPGPVVGMLLLFVALHLRRGLPDPLQQTAQTILQYLSLLFVPAGVGVIQHLDLMRNEWFGLAITLLLSTLLTLSITALVMQGLLRLQRGRGPQR